MGRSEIMFSRSPDGIEKALRQGEILTNVVELLIEPTSIKSAEAGSSYDINPVRHPFAIIVSQDCDLEQDFNFRFCCKGNVRHELPSILFCQAQSMDKLRKSETYRSLFTSSTFKGNFKNNNEIRFHFIQEIPAGCSAGDELLPELGIDFKRYFSMPTSEVYHRIMLDHTQRRSVLESPYRDHFSQRFYNFNNRIALPEEYESA